MILDKERSPEQIHDYFDLLRWRKTGSIVEIQTELIETAEYLLPINKELSSNQEAISLITESLSSLSKIIASVRDLISSVKQEILLSDREIESIIREIELVSREIKTLTKEIESINRKIELVRETWSSNRTPVQSFIIPQLSLRELGTRLCREIISDFIIILSIIWQSFKKQPLITIAVGSGLILLGLLLGIIFTSLSNLIILILVFIYIFKKIIFINKKYQKSEQIKFVNREKLRLQNIELDLQSNKQELEIERQKLETRQLELEAKRQELEARHLELEVERQEHEARHLELETRIKTAEQELVELEQIREKILETRQNQFDNLKDYERELKEVRLRTLEEKIKEWLAQDKLTLHERASKILLIQIGRESGELNTIQTSEPIQRFFGVNSRNIARRQAIIETDRGNNLSQAKDLDLLIKNQDFRKGIGLDGKERYGVYEFISIFFCANFLAYYRCYWNFIRCLPVEEEICEILYDSIVSVKVKERSSASLKDQERKRIYREFLSITTMDGKIFSFRIDEDRTERTEGNLRQSQIEEAGRTIRDILRQRRIDITRIKNVDD